MYLGGVGKDKPGSACIRLRHLSVAQLRFGGEIECSSPSQGWGLKSATRGFSQPPLKTAVLRDIIKSPVASSAFLSLYFWQRKKRNAASSGKDTWYAAYVLKWTEHEWCCSSLCATPTSRPHPQPRSHVAPPIGRAQDQRWAFGTTALSRLLCRRWVAPAGSTWTWKGLREEFGSR